VFCRKSETPKITRRRPRRASKEEAFGGHEDGEHEPMVSHPPCSEGRRVSAPHWGSARRCPNIIDYITPLTVYSIGGVGS
jgi:hypothetical protein